MRKILAILVVVCMLSLAACGPMTSTTAAGQTGVTIEQQNSGLDYLQQSLTMVQAAAAQAKLQKPADAAAIDAQVMPVIQQLQSSIALYQQTVNTPASSEAWATARAVLTTAVSVLGPIAIEAIL